MVPYVKVEERKFLLGDAQRQTLHAPSEILYLGDGLVLVHGIFARASKHIETEW